MENFVLYDEIGRGERTVVYKGRRKGTITFLAIHCIEKSKRPYITNRVRLTHELHHENVVEFYEWYETSNHLWLVVELCTGGSLETILVQDSHLPESCLRKFGIDMVKGLHHLHSLGIVYTDLKPSKLLLDGPGVLKFSDFELARAEGENLDQLFETFIESADGDQEDKYNYETNVSAASFLTGNTSVTDPLPDGSTSYMSPERTRGAPPSFSSDIWSLGCVLYEMFTGHPPFEGETYQQLVNKIQMQTHAAPRVKGSRLNTKPSKDLVSLIDSLLEKDVTSRLGWSALVVHPFWEGGLQELVKEVEASLDPGTQTIRDSIVRQSLILNKSAAEPTQNLESTMSQKSLVEGQSVKLSAVERPSTAGDKRSRATPERDSKVAFSMSRPSTAGHVEQAAVVVTSYPCDVTQTKPANDDVTSLLYHQSDVISSSIIDNPKILKPASLKYDAKTIPVPPYSLEKLSSMSEVDFNKHVQQVHDVISAPEKGPPSQKRLHLLNYAATIAAKEEVSNRLVRAGLLIVLVRQIKEQNVPEVRLRLSRLIGLIANNVTELDESTNMTEVLTSLCDVLRDCYRVVKTKQCLLPALGELIYLVASQEDMKGYAVDNWSAPSMTYTLILRALRDTEDGIVNHYAAKIVENVSTTDSQHAQKFVSNDVGQALWFIFTHAKTDSVRVTTIMALCLICRQSAAVFQSIIDKSGLSSLLHAMNTSLNKIQQAVSTMFTQLIISGTMVQRLVTDKEFVTQTMKLLDSSSPVVRGKTFLLIHQILLANEDALLTCCQARLVMYMERDVRRQTPKSSDQSQDADYLGKCLLILQDHVVQTLPKITVEILSTLDSVNGRKHPSSVQTRQIKQTVPMMPVFLHILTSQLFRPRVVDETLISQLASFLKHVRAVDSGDLNLDAAIGAGSSDSFVQTTFSMVESISQHPHLVVVYERPLVADVMPVLADLLSCSNGDTRVLSLKLLTEMSGTLLAGETPTNQNQNQSYRQLHDVISRLLIEQYEQILFDQDPLPSYGLKLLHSVIEQSPQFIRKFQTAGLSPALFQVLLDHQTSPLGTVVQTIVQILTCMVNYKETNMHELYDSHLVDHMITLFLENCQSCLSNDERIDSKTSHQAMMLLMDLLHDIFKYLSEVVRKALQSKKSGADGGTMEADQAEKLLMTNKPFTDLTNNLAQLMCSDDPDLSEQSLKCLSLMVQLFGGECQEAMSPDNMVCYSKALRYADARKQKILLRIIKRYLVTEPEHALSMRNEGGQLLDTIKSSIHNASTTADLAVSSLANEILKLVT